MLRLLLTMLRRALQLYMLLRLCVCLLLQLLLLHMLLLHMLLLHNLPRLLLLLLLGQWFLLVVEVALPLAQLLELLL